MDFSKKLGFVGSNKHEILLYLGAYMNLLDLRCVIIDASIEQNLKYVIPVVVEDNVITYQGVDYIININSLEDYNGLNLTMYDVVIVDFGFNMDFINEMNQFDDLFIVTDFMKYNVEKLGYILKAIAKSVKVVKIYKDFMPAKISKRFVDRKLGLDKYHNVLEEYIFELDEKNYKSQLNIQYNDKFLVHKINKPYQIFCNDVVEELFDISIKDVKKLVKQKGRRKKNASGFLEYRSWSISNNH